MELLAPAGNIENFHAAIEAGADAVYIGAPGINARNLSRDLSLEEIGAMIRYAHDLGKKVYLAANSLILEHELPQLLETLALLESLEPDALIVQDLALLHLVQEYFPALTLHASTLMGAHNSETVELLKHVGCERVVLARELTLKEIASLAGQVDIELEVFVHGAMCYSYSGLCLFSSYLGGKSGLRGRCVQPCRRGYTWQSKSSKSGRSNKRKGGSIKSAMPKMVKGGSYLFSMNDLEGFAAVQTLRDAGIASLKIEGRLRTANYVGKIVSAYRHVLDSTSADLDDAIQVAEKLAKEAMGRRTSSGYFFSPQPKDAIVPHHSGNLGIYLGFFSSIKQYGDKLIGKIKLRSSLDLGDRLRAHIETSGERKSFTLKEMQKGGEAATSGGTNQVVTLLLPLKKEQLQESKVELYKTDSGTNFRSTADLRENVDAIRKNLKLVKKENRRYLEELRQQLNHKTDISPLKLDKRNRGVKRGKNGFPQHIKLDLWLKTDSPKLVLNRLPFIPDMLLLHMDKNMLSKSSQIKKYLGKNSRKVVWSLPAVALDSDLSQLRKQITLLLRTGFTSFQIAHIGQFALFGEERVRLYGDYTLNLANSQALHVLTQAGLDGAQAAIELDRENMYRLVKSSQSSGVKSTGTTQVKRMSLGLTVYGAPPLFTSRLAGNHLQMNRPFVSPKNEEFVIHKSQGSMLTLPKRPFSLLPYLKDIQNIGFDYVVVDLSYQKIGEREMQEIYERLGNTGRYGKLPTFNYLGKLE